MNNIPSSKYELTIPVNVAFNPVSEGAVLSERIVAAQMGCVFNWEGLSELDFTATAHKIIYQACKWLELMREDCTHSNVRVIAELIAKEDYTDYELMEVEHLMKHGWLHRQALMYNDLLAHVMGVEHILKGGGYNHAAQVKKASRNRFRTAAAANIMENVVYGKSCGYWIDVLKNTQSVKRRKSRGVWK